MLLNANGTANYKWHLAHDLRQTIEKMTPEERRRALERIQAERLIRKPDREMYRYVRNLLKGNTHCKGISRVKKNTERRSI